MDNIKELIKEFCDDQDLDYKDDYSGRRMYGKNCIAITCDDPLTTLSQLFAYIIDSEDDITGFNVEKALGKPVKDKSKLLMIRFRFRQIVNAVKLLILKQIQFKPFQNDERLILFCFRKYSICT